MIISYHPLFFSLHGLSNNAIWDSSSVHYSQNINFYCLQIIEQTELCIILWLFVIADSVPPSGGSDAKYFMIFLKYFSCLRRCLTRDWQSKLLRSLENHRQYYCQILYPGKHENHLFQFSSKYEYFNSVISKTKIMIEQNAKINCITTLWLLKLHIFVTYFILHPQNWKFKC